MIEKIIEYSAKNKLVIILLYVVIIGWGYWSMVTTPVDAIPDLSDNQVIVFTEWMGRSPKIIEDQVTYPLVMNLQGLPRVKSVRAQSMFGMSFIYIIFEDDVDIYWARSRVMERLNSASALLPAGVAPTIGPDGTGVGHIFWYTVEGAGYDLGELRAVQDWYIRYQLNAVPGVAEVASAGGFVKQYQIDLDPLKLAAYDVDYRSVVEAVQNSNRDVGGKIIESNGSQSFVRGIGYLTSADEIGGIAVGRSANGTPVTINRLGTVRMGSDLRLGLLEKDGKGETVGGIVVMRYGENAKEVIRRVKERIAEIAPGLPKGIEIKPAYDRSELIDRSIDTLKNALLEEALVVSLVVMIFIMHVRSAIRILLELPVSILFAFILMKQFGITSNIMSLGGIAIAIGVLVDSSIVLVENAHRNIAQLQAEGRVIDYEAVSIFSAQQVGRAIFFSLTIIVVSFLPVFLLEGQEGKLFHPLAWTKTFSLAASAIISITLVPMLMTFFMRGKFKPESVNPVSRIMMRMYEPMLRFSLRHRKGVLAVSLLALLATVPMLMHLGSEFMPPLDEGSLLFMPVALPNVNITEAKRILSVQDKIIAGFPEVQQVLGKVGRAETSTDPAPISMIETIIMLKPKSQWRPGMTRDGIITALDKQLQIPGVRNGWTQPIINRINMLSTGIRTDLGVKIFGHNLDTLESIAFDAERCLRTLPGASDLYTDRANGGMFLDIAVRPEAIARYGLTPGDILSFIEIAVGGENITTAVQGRERFPVRVRFIRSAGTGAEQLGRLLVPVAALSPSQDRTAAGMAASAMSMETVTPAPAVQDRQTAAKRHQFIPLALLADIRESPGPVMVSSENGLLRSVVVLNVRGRDLGGFVNDAKSLLQQKLTLPPGYYISWSGQYENEVRAKNRITIVLPIVFLIILFLLYFTFKSWLEASMVMLSVPFALIGGVYLIAFLGYNLSVAVWVGFIALYGIAVETGVVMVIYLHEALDRYIVKGAVTEEMIRQATVDGAVLRLRPKMMTVMTNIIGLLPIMWSTGAGSDVMRPIAAPMIGGILTSALHVLFVTPVIFSLLKESACKRGKLEISKLRQK
jgi:Cu(I)/Ag(I) efflux system membrane protein CusA/SilA